MKERCIHFDGIDKCGKDTIADRVIKETEGKILIFRRSYISQIVYALLYDRKIDYDFFYNRAKADYNNGDIFFLFVCNEKELIKRFLATEEKDVSIKDINKHIKTFEKVYASFEDIGLKIERVDTSELSIEDTVDLVIQILKAR